MICFFRKAFIFFFAVVLAGCAMSIEDIGATMKESMQLAFDGDARFKELNLTVTDIQVLKQGGNHYQGIAKVIYDGTAQDVPVEITVDGKRVIWKPAPDAFAFVAQKQP